MDWKPYQNVKPRKAKASCKKSDGLPSEAQEQSLLATWLDRQNIRFFAIPNGAWHKNIHEGLKLKRTGVKRGTPDLAIPLPRKPYHGLYIELKRQKGGKPTPEQVDWINFLNNVGYRAEISYGFEDAKQLILNYLSLPQW